ncbi:MAG: hypothetical protein K5905_26460 [Roseibium sp.]|uniref:hypothetical protein n=1 Tax=Roseibium sp. TaxID=1936156 RepID=UPI00262BDC7D|nr:hypothetical protein [Roseibium sp.]MCV0429013.1 hypothetical protein [Roseibium sp.]
MSRYLMFVFVSFFVIGPTRAGTPVHVEQKCPIGGETFIIVKSPSCSYFGQSMSFRRVSTCDYITRLPVCPGNDLPIFREFSTEEVGKLSEFVETEEFGRLRQLDPWQRAYKVEEYLGQTGSSSGFLLLLQALWYENESFLADEQFLDLFAAEAEAEIDRVENAEKPFVAAILAYAFAAAENRQQADAWFERAKSLNEQVGNDASSSDFLRSYLTKLSTCRNNMTSAECSPDAPFEPEQKN